MTHPIRKAEIHVFRRVSIDDAQPISGGVEYVARFFPYKTYPIIFEGRNDHDVIAKAEAFRADAIAKHEKDLINREKTRKRNQARKATSNA